MDSNKTPCDICGSENSTPIDADPRVHVCNACGFVYVPERRDPGEIAADWDWVYAEGHYDPTWPGVRARLFYVAEWLDQQIGLDGKTVLDIGAGDGFFLDQIRRRGAYPVGLEAYRENVKKVRALDIHCHLGTVETAGMLGKFDLITFNWCLENNGSLTNPLNFAREHLLQDGLVSVATGSRILSGYRKPITSYFNLELPADLHCFHFAPKTLRWALAMHGLSEDTTLNDFKQNDVLVGIARSGEPRTAKQLDVFEWGDPLASTYPNAVVLFFKDWQACPWV